MAALLVGCASLVGTAPPALAGTRSAKRWEQDAFWISFWVGPQVAEPELEFRFAEIAEANFTGYLGFNGNSGTPYLPNASRVKAEIELCDRHGLKCVPSLCGARLGSRGADSPCFGLGEGSPNLWGWQLLDEPGETLFPRIGNWTKQLAADRPGLLNFVNVLGEAPFASPDAYDAYIANYVASVRPQVLSMDFYPVFTEPLPAPAAGSSITPAAGSSIAANVDAASAVWGSAVAGPGISTAGTAGGVGGDTGRMPESKDDYGETIGVLRYRAETAAGGPIPFWVFFDAMEFSTGRTDPSEAMLRWQAMTAVAYGASGVMYFCYWSPFEVFKLGGGLMVPRGTPAGETIYERGPHWYEAQRLNGVVRIYGGFLLGRRSLGVYRANTTAGPHHDGIPFSVGNATVPAPPCVIAGLDKNGPSYQVADWLIGVFDLTEPPRWGPGDIGGSGGGGGRLAVPAGYTHAVVLQNQDENRNVWTTLRWAAGVSNGTVLELDSVQGVLRPLLDDSPWDTGLQIALDVGGARLFVLKSL